MNKTIIINISGTIFHIEEDAYDVLRHYMSDVKMYFGTSNDSFEIVTDIENRIAELFAEILKNKSSQVIVSQDVQQVIVQMGRPEDFHDDDTQASEPILEKESISNKKLYRDMDDKVLGGVCGGLGYYFGIDAVWVRVFFALLFWVGGFTIMAYIVLWIAMPPARTRAEKLAMAGEKVNLETIRNSVTNELNEVQVRIKKYGNALRTGAAGSRFGDLIEEFGVIALRFIELFGKFIMLIIGLISLIFGIALIFSAIVFAVVFAIHPEKATFFGPVFFDLSPTLMLLAWTSITIFIAIPAVFLLFAGIRLLSKRSLMNGLTIRTLLVIWFFALIACTYTGLSIAKSFSQEASITQEVMLKPVGNNTFYLKPGSAQDETDSSFNKDVKTNNRINWHINVDQDYRHQVNIEIQKQDTGKAIIKEIFSSRGGEFHDALRHADKIRYHFQQKDSVLSFPSYISWDGDSFRAQKASIILKIPVNTTIIADPELQEVYLPDLNDYEKIDGKNNIFIMTSSGLKPKFLKHKKYDEDGDIINQSEDSTQIEGPPKPPSPPGSFDHSEKQNRSRKVKVTVN